MGVVFLGSYLCISILEFKCKKSLTSSLTFAIYVFLYQNLNMDNLKETMNKIKIYVFLYQNLNQLHL